MPPSGSTGGGLRVSASSPGSRISLWPLTAAEATALVGGALHGDEGARALRVATDSRAGVRSGDLFVGLVGPHFDGGRFAGAVLAQGATVAVVGPAHADAARQLCGEPGRAVIVVADPLAALHALAGEARRRFRGTVVAITGSNGKTTVKDMLTAALGDELAVTASPLSYNSQVGVALSLLGIDPAARVAVIECGISAPGEMERTARIVRPDCGILTSIGDAHLEGLGSRERTAEEKSQLFHAIPRHDEAAAGGWVLVPDDEALGRRALEAVGAPIVTVGGVGADFRLEAEQGRLGPRGHLVRAGEHPPSPIPLEISGLQPGLEGGTVAEHWMRAGALAAAAARLLGASPRTIATGLATWHPAPMRLEISTTPRGLLLINDAYTADPLSMEAALDTLARERGAGSGAGRSVAVLGGMAQLGRARRKAHAAVGRRVAEERIDRLVGVGAGGREIAAAALEAGMEAARVTVVDDVTAAAAELEEYCRPGDRVLLKASRPARLERVAELLSDAVAPARLYVDLDRVIANYHAVRHAAGPGCGVMAVVKSFGYGVDAVRVSRALEHAGVDAFAVAYADEGVRLRDHGITAPVLVQNILPKETGKVVRHGLAAQVWTREQVDALAAEAERQRRPVRLHLKVDTGMGRSGVAPEAALQLGREIRNAEWLLLEGLATHFAAADDPLHDEFTREQIRRFDEVREAFANAGLEVAWTHAAASAAVARFPEARYTMVRCGLALFGYVRAGTPAAGGAGNTAPELVQVPVLRMTTRVIAVKQIPRGHSVGYGRTFHAEDRPRRIAVVALGYNDGYPWVLSNRGWMLLRGRRCPVVGRVSMDVTTLDVTELGDEARPGDEVVVFGPAPDEPSLLDLAELAGTIPYELLTRISPRVRRIFWHGEGSTPPGN